ncbi:glycosyl transferase [Paenibacillus darwinianus]|uniref:Glycosyl transferase n=1 Tax=Paenibacillus darwinianus TaxID=1380763 RepID=A0A9W5W797_9BACL|nr:glycosyltransferase [Paenibacillus darwinianus]EXX89145.1 glycosyl transferase [Paenibacillus darwinianus]EXX89533.1 glycosyl transferase [Paenibacillus darwinianus]EXX89788.1 glycosyl transferase [Paenibacillus darwinianus]
MPDVSVVIPFYNDPYVAEAVESVLAQTRSGIEIIVVDDGSVRCADKLARYEGRIHYIGQANGGTAAALNTGFRLASGTYVAWLSSDDKLHSEKIERQYRAMSAESAWLGHTAFSVIDGRGKVTERCVSPPGLDCPAFYRAFVGANPVNGCTVMMRKELYTRLGGFDESLAYTHDLDFWYRAMLAGYPFHYLPEPLTYYRKHKGMGTLRHRAAVTAEAQATFARYAAPWRRFLTQIGVQAP